MRALRPALLILVCLLVATSLSAQQPFYGTSTNTSPLAANAPSSSDPQAVALLEKSIDALTGGGSINDVTMTGTLTLTASGALARHSLQASAGTQSGTAKLVATDTGQSEVISTTSAGTQTTIQDISGTAPILAVTNTKGVTLVVQTASAVAPHPSWFYPPFLLASGLSSQYVVSYIGQETFDGIAVEHIAMWRTKNTSPVSEAVKRASRENIYLDSKSLLPVAITFMTHPFNPKNPNKPILAYGGRSPDHMTVIQYLDYQQVEGKTVALEVRSTTKVIPQDQASDLVSDIQISSVNFNTGATIAVPTAN